MRTSWLLLAATFLAAFVWGMLGYQRGVIEQSIEEALAGQLTAESDWLAALAAKPGAEARLRELGTQSERRITLIAADGTVRYDSMSDPAGMDNHNSRDEVQQARSRGRGVSRRHSDTIGKELLYVAKALPDGSVVRIAAPLAIEQSLVHRLSFPITLAAVAMLAVAMGIAALHFWRDRLRVHELMAVARAYGAGQFDRRAALIGRDILNRLGHELNALGERLQTNRDQLAQQRSLLDGALGALSEGVACVDRLDRVVYANAAFRQLAAGGAEVLGQVFYEHLPAAAITDPLQAVRGGGSGKEIEFDHRRRHLRAGFAPAGPEMAVLVLYDQTELKRLESARRDFVAAVSHELKTPLTSILGYGETLLDGAIDDPANARPFVEKMMTHAERLAALVRDVLSLSRLEQGAWLVRPQEIDLVKVARTVIDEYQATAAAREIKLVLEAPAALSAVTDPELVRQLVGNLVSNAIRYNRQAGTVWLRLRDGDAGSIGITVQDTGIGIPAEHQERVFERFYRIDAHRSRQTGGTGLGLAIVKHLLNVLGGSITLHSDANGTRFEVTVPRVDGRAQLTAKAGSNGEG